MSKQPEIPIPTPIRENPKSFVWAPESQIDTLIAVEQTYNGEDTYQQLESLAKEQLEIPSPFPFMTYRQDTYKASKGKTQLLYADNTEVPKNIATDLWKRLSSGHNGGCWTRLNALFLKEKKEDKSSPWNYSTSTVWYMETDLQVINDEQDISLRGNRQPLNATVLDEDCYATLEFNRQGLPIKKSRIQFYNAGKNIYFVYPREGAGAWFGAVSDGAYLICGRDPTIRGTSLGVLASAKGARAIAKILGGRK